MSHFVIRIEGDMKKKSVTDVKISKEVNAIQAAIILNQLAADLLLHVNETVVPRKPGLWARIKKIVGVK